jgi:hypothetical protein
MISGRIKFPKMGAAFGLSSPINFRAKGRGLLSKLVKKISKGVRVVLTILLWIGSLSPPAQSQENREYLIKAGFLYNFTKFVDWPAGSFKNESAPFILLIYGSDPFRSAIEAIRDKPVKGRRLIIKQAQRLEQLEEAHMVYIGSSEKTHLKSILLALRGRPVLTVSDWSHFAQAGGMIGLVTVEETIKLEINPEAVKLANLNMSIQLLKLAKIVSTGQ